jgi:hypothetical protein
MKYLNWDFEKNEILKHVRGISFEKKAMVKKAMVSNLEL